MFQVSLINYRVLPIWRLLTQLTPQGGRGKEGRIFLSSPQRWLSIHKSVKRGSCTTSLRESVWWSLGLCVAGRYCLFWHQRLSEDVLHAADISPPLSAQNREQRWRVETTPPLSQHECIALFFSVSVRTGILCDNASYSPVPCNLYIHSNISSKYNDEISLRF